ncbi:MAG TPA: DUF1592 domain-containing protein [Bryobacteraceae bacterium]|nr:DUF1592 domain-containing protein [Bryobacteraceae bacterium]
MRPAVAQTPPPEYRQTLQPFLAKNCATCHNDKVKAAGLSLEQYRSDPGLWAKVADKIASGRMPPPGAPQPLKTEVAAVLALLEKPTGDPGRVTMRRLNRVEYNNTVRDLLGVSLRPADEFPLDDAGYGFDNIGDVLSVSPLLMEKYANAARVVSKAAVYGEQAPSKPTKLIRFLGKKSQDDPTANALPYSYRGALWATYDFPVDGEYEFHMRDANYRPRARNTPRQRELSFKRGLSDSEKAELAELNRKSDPPVRMSMTLDGKQILTEVVEGNIDYAYAHGESIARVRVAAGEHSFRASYPEYADLANPRDNVNLDGRRKIFIDYIDIVGPFDPAKALPASRGRIFVCGEKTDACSAQIVAALSRRAYRRPVTAREQAELTQLAALVRKNGESFDESIRVALQAMLMSPNFLFRAEREVPGSGAVPVEQHDLASRLSYFIWSSMPDEDLMRAADAGKLTMPDVFDAQLRRMLNDPKADALIDNFAGQWLGLRLLDKRRPDPAKFPAVDDELLDAMREETTLFARAVMREDRSVLDFLDGRFTFVNGPLARFYGIPDVSGEAFRRVELDGEKRGGIMTQGAILTLSSYATRTSPVIRGKWVLENLLGTPPPPPPPDVPALEEKELGQTASLRERLEQHRANAACAVCHRQMDPIGFGLENYDASGAWRDSEGKFPIDSSGTLPGGASFSGPKELKRVLRNRSDLFARNLTEKMLTYALGRGLEPYDRSTVDAILGRLSADNYKFSTLVTEVAKSKPFQKRRAEGDSNAW